jgi:hypothetical protein
MDYLIRIAEKLTFPFWWMGIGGLNYKQSIKERKKKREEAGCSGI